MVLHRPSKTSSPRTQGYLAQASACLGVCHLPANPSRPNPHHQPKCRLCSASFRTFFQASSVWNQLGNLRRPICLYCSPVIYSMEHRTVGQIRCLCPPTTIISDKAQSLNQAQLKVTVRKYIHIVKKTFINTSKWFPLSTPNNSPGDTSSVNNR